MSSPDQNKAHVKAFYDLAFNQRQPEEIFNASECSRYGDMGTGFSGAPSPLPNTAD